MFEGPKFSGEPTAEKKRETVEEKIKRLRPIIEKSLDLYEPEAADELGVLTATRERADGTLETLEGLIAMDINADGVELAGIDADGYPTASATMLWMEIVNFTVKE
jgi:hypothetical protein